MKRIVSLVLCAVLLCGLAVLAEESSSGDAGSVINCLIEDGSYVIQIPVKAGDTGWVADDMSQDDSVVALGFADVLDDTFVVRYDPTGDGEVTVCVKHMDGIACDEAHTWDLRVKDGAVQEAFGGSYTAAPDEADIDLCISGEWWEKETQFTRMGVAKSAEKGWDVEIVSPVSHGAYVFRATVFYDCELDALVYGDGAFYDVPVTAEEDADLGEPVASDTTGTLSFEGGSPEEGVLIWYSDQKPDETVAFERAEAAGVDTSGWEYYTFEGSNVAMKLPADFENVTDEPEPGIFFNAGNADVVLQVIPVEGDFADRGALTAYYEGQDYVVQAAQVEINGMELVYIQGGDDDVTAYAVISPEGTTYCFVFIPQSDDGESVISAMASTICPSGSIPAGGRMVEPLPYEIDLADPGDGIYPAAFDRGELVDGALTLRIFTVDCYDIVDISQLSVGDCIVIDGQVVEVESLERADDLRINGGCFEGGYDLRAYDEDNCYRLAQEDDFPTWTEHGQTTLPLDDAVVFEDGWDIERAPETTSGAADVARAISESENDSFDQYNTTVRIESGKIVEIDRVYVP